MPSGRKQCNQRKNHSSQEKYVKDQLWFRFQITRRRINNISCLKKESGFKLSVFTGLLSKLRIYHLKDFFIFHAGLSCFICSIDLTVRYLKVT